MLFSNNPYTAGNPVGNSPAFVGRDDILRDVLRMLRHHHENAIVLFGQRRIGKTSILQELLAKLSEENNYCPIFFDLQSKAKLPLGKILQDLAIKIGHEFGQPQPDLGDDPKINFSQTWLPELLNNLPQNTSLVLLFDEFDVLADHKSKEAGEEFFPYLRDLLETHQENLNSIFVIGRKVEDLSHIALSLFKTMVHLHVSLLTREDTIKIICFSENNKTLNWPDNTIDLVWELTCGHPFLTQRLCSCVWERIYDRNPNEVPTATIKDIKDAIPNTLDSSLNTLEWLWDGLNPSEKIVISVLAGAGKKTITEIQLENLLYENGIQRVIRELKNAPRILQDWDLLEPTNDGYRFKVELLRLWIEKYKPLERVQELLDRIEPVANNLYEAGLRLYHDNELDEALPPLRQSIKLNPNHIAANQLLVEILLGQEKINEAYKLLKKLFEYQPSIARPDLIYALLSLAQQSDKEEKKLEYYTEILKIAPEHPEAKNKRKYIIQQREKRQKKEERKSLIFSVMKSIGWFLIFGGLSSVFLLIIFSESSKNHGITFEQFIMNGWLLLFATTIISSVTMDYFLLSTKDEVNKNFVALSFVMYPATILISCIIVFFILYVTPLKEINFQLLYIVEYTIVLFALIYLIFTKFYIIKYNYTNKNRKLISFTWPTLTYFFGLLPVCTILLVSNFTTIYEFTPLFNKIIMDGSLLFFIVIIPFLTLTDYLVLGKKPNFDDEGLKVVFYVLLFVVGPGFLILLILENHANLIEKTYLTYISLIISFLYSIFVKYNSLRR